MLIVFFIALSICIYLVFYFRRRAQRESYIRSYMFPPGLLQKFARLHPERSLKDQQLVARALRQFFLVYLKSGYQHISMPTQIVDDLWHEFILYTKNYEMFCKRAFGRYMHHTPASMLGESQRNNDGLRTTWHFACLEENINPRHATRLPLLFALDAKWNIKDGFQYAPDCSALKKNADGVIYCGADFSGSGNDVSFGFSSNESSSDASSSSDSGSCNGGCSGGCSGGD